MREKLWIKIAWLLPRELVKWCFIRVAINGTDNNSAPTETKCLDALNKW